MTVILDQFVQTLRECGLMTAEEIEGFLAGLPADEKPQTGEDLARLLHRYQKLTKFQTQAVYQGKTKGLVFGNYIVLDKIGQGGMGYVYKARHRRMKRVVALKVLPSAVAKSPAAIKRFEREVEAAAKLSHPHIVTAYDADEADGIHFLVMEYVEGTDLANVVRRDGPLPVSRSLDYILQAAKGLEFAHRHQVIHRDIKPSNLVLDREGVVKILDMGLARFEREMEAATRSESLTESGQVMGTLDYMAPEQAQDTHRADARADIYSLGCTLFHLLMGRPVFGGDTLTQKILAHRDEPAPSLSSLREGIPPELDAVFRRMVAKRPEDRQPSMSEVIVELEACRKREAQAVTDTASFHAGPTGGGDTAIHAADAFADLTEREGTAGEQWLHAPLPLLPTLVRRPTRKPGVWDTKWLVPSAIAIGVAFLALLLGVVLKFRTTEGTLVVEVNQPDAQVDVDGGKFTITTPDSQEPVEIEVDEGKHTLRVTKGGFQSFTKEFSIQSRGKETIRVELRASTENPVATPPAPPVVASTSPAKEPLAPAAAPKTAATTPAVVASTASDPHRRAAEAVLKLGGTVTVVTASPRIVAVAAEKDFPAEPFALIGVSLRGRSDVRDANLKELAGIYYLETLDLTGTSITDAGLKHLGRVDMARIYVSDTAVSDESAKWLSGRQDLLQLQIGSSGASPLRLTDAACTYLTQLPRLRNLSFAGTEVGDRGLVDLSTLLSLQSIQVGGNCSVKGLASLRALPNLQYLELSKNSTGDELVDLLPRFPQLRFVTPWYHGCPDALALKLQKALPNATVYHPAVAASEPERQSLRWLLDNKAVARGYSPAGWDSIFHDVPQGPFSVSVASAESGPASGAVNLRGLRAIRNLQWPNLKTADAEAEHIATLSSLLGLQLGGSDLSDTGIGRLTSLRQLQSLGLPGCRLVTDRGLEHLTTLRQLAVLDIAGLPLSNEGLAHVGRIDGLQHLCLASCVNLTSEGLKHLTRLPILRQLNLTSTPIDDSAVKHLKQMSCLRILWLNGTKVSASGIEELRRALPKCVIFWDGDAVIATPTPPSVDSALPAGEPLTPPPSSPPSGATPPASAASVVSPGVSPATVAPVEEKLRSSRRTRGLS